VTEVILELLDFDRFVGEVKDGELHIGQTAVPVYNPENKTKVPDVLFYENHQVRTGRILSFGIWLRTKFSGVSPATAAESKSTFPL